jgi:hypothetical protein
MQEIMRQGPRQAGIGKKRKRGFGKIKGKARLSSKALSAH